MRAWRKRRWRKTWMRRVDGEGLEKHGIVGKQREGEGKRKRRDERKT